MKFDLSRSFIQVIFNKANGSYLLTVPSESRLKMLLSYMLDENEFLSTFGVRSLSKVSGTFGSHTTVGQRVGWKIVILLTYTVPVVPIHLPVFLAMTP